MNQYKKLEDIKTGDVFNLSEKRDKRTIIKGACISTTGIEVIFKNLDYPEVGNCSVKKYSADKYYNVTIF